MEDTVMATSNTREKKVGILSIVGKLFVVLSVMINIIIILLIAVGIYFAAGRSDTFIEETVMPGSHLEKIAVLNLEGIIAAESYNSFHNQLKTAQSDDTVKAVIVRIDSPGGSVSHSDNIYHLISQYRKETGKTVVCYMDGLAASGGYYSAVACDKIIASPTTITGSIGVIMGHFNINGLLAEKLGITQTTIKSGEKKDWPSMFREISPQEKQYLVEKVINPAYERFVSLVEQGRKNLTGDEVRALADGGIYFADEAKEKGLVDDIGYIEKAVEITKDLANLENPKVVEYKKPFSFSEFMSSESKTNLLSVESFKEMACPEIMYLWTGQN